MSTSKHNSDARAAQFFALSLLAYAHDAKPHRLYHRIVLGVFTIMLALALFWMGGAFYGAQYELQGAVFPVRSSDKWLTQTLTDKVNDYQLVIVRPDGQQNSFSMQQAGIKVDIKSSIALTRQKQQELESRLQWWRPVPFELVVRADTQALNTFIGEQASTVVQPPQDASLKLVDGEVQLTDEVAGKQYGLDNPTQTILRAVSRLDSEPLEMKVVTLRPSVTAKAVADTKAKLDLILNQSITIAIDDQKVQPRPQDIANWINVIPDPEHKTIHLAVNAESVQFYMQHLARNYSRSPRSQVTLSSGAVVPGAPGHTVGNTDAALAALTDSLLRGEGIVVDLPLETVPYKTIAAAGAGRWIEVDLTTKRLHAYEYDNAVRTFLISAGAADTPTVTGTFAIYSKYSQQTMSGPNADGSRYVQPNVPWVSYFYQDYAIHGNYWRPTSYFGNVHSSHGCVGLLTGDAAWLYSWAPVGTPVVVHL